MEKRQGSRGDAKRFLRQPRGQSLPTRRKVLQGPLRGLNSFGEDPSPARRRNSCSKSSTSFPGMFASYGRGSPAGQEPPRSSRPYRFPSTSGSASRRLSFTGRPAAIASRISRGSDWRIWRCSSRALFLLVMNSGLNPWERRNCSLVGLREGLDLLPMHGQVAQRFPDGEVEDVGIGGQEMMASPRSSMSKSVPSGSKP